MEDGFVVRFWGVRGSYPVPGDSTLRVGGNTPCVEINVNGHLIIIDAGTGIISLGHELLRRSEATGEAINACLFFSHTHHDHTQGIPYFKPAYLSTSTFHVFGPNTVNQQINDVLQRAMLPPNFPVQLNELHSQWNVRPLNEVETVWLLPDDSVPVVRTVARDGPIDNEDSVRIDVLKSYAHPREGVYLYKVSYHGHSIVYASDTEGYQGGDRRLIQFARGVDVLIHDAQYTLEAYVDRQVPKQGWGHSTPGMAISVAQEAKVGTLAFFHYEPTYDDEMLFRVEAQAQDKFAGAMLAREGVEIDILDC